MGELTARDDMKELYRYPRLYYPGMLLAISGRDGAEQYVTVLEVRDHAGPWVTLVYRPTTRMDTVRDWLARRAWDVLRVVPGPARRVLARLFGLQPARFAALWHGGDDGQA